MDTKRPKPAKASQSAGATLGNQSQDKGKKKTRKKKRGRRRGKKDVILDFTKRAKQSTSDGLAPIMGKLNAGKVSELSVDKSGKKKNARGKLSLTTSIQDYGGNLNLPANITQREYETTGQFLKRLNRLVAKAKVEASMDDRFDMKISEGRTMTATAGGSKSKQMEHENTDQTKFGHRKRRVKR